MSYSSWLKSLPVTGGFCFLQVRGPLEATYAPIDGPTDMHMWEAPSVDFKTTTTKIHKTW